MQGDDKEFVDIYDENVSIFVRCEHLARYIYASEQIRKRRANCVLDIACGSGYGSMEIARYASKTIAVDKFLPSNLKNNSCVSFVKSDINAQGFSNALPDVVDAVVCFETLEHINEPYAFVAELTTILKRKGLFFISVPNGEMEKKDESGQSINEFHLHSFSESQLIDLAQQAGLKVLRKLYQPTSAALYRNESRAIRDLTLDNDYAKKMTSSITDLHYFSRVFAWPDENAGMSYSMILMCEKD